jgi:hypothetical protein
MKKAKYANRSSIFTREKTEVPKVNNARTRRPRSHLWWRTAR